MADARIVTRPLPVPTTEEVVIVEMSRQQAEAVRFLIGSVVGPAADIVRPVHTAIRTVCPNGPQFFIVRGAQTEAR